MLSEKPLRQDRQFRPIAKQDIGSSNAEAQITWFKQLCNGCDACTHACPQGAISITEGDCSVELVNTPCSNACPAGVDVPRYIRALAAGKFDEAIAVTREKIPFPGVCGYVCLSPCESVCLRRYLDNPILIRELKRAAFEYGTGQHILKLVPITPTGHRVGIIGSGPAGLTAAYFLARKGHQVTVFETQSSAGGKMMHSIRDWHLPKDVLATEIADIEAAGVEIKTSHKIESAESLFDGGFESVLLAGGLHREPILPPMTEKADLDAQTFLSLNTLPEMNGRKIVILGGGESAFKCALKANQLGASEIHLVSIEYQGKTESDVIESEHALDTGVVIHSWRMFPKIIRRDGHIIGVEYFKMRAFGFDAESKFSMDPVIGSERFIAADLIIDATGGSGQNHSTANRPGFFAAGDAVSELRSVIEAIAAGSWAASAIDRFLGGEGDIDIHHQDIGSIPVQPIVPKGTPHPEVPVNMLPGGYAQVELTLSKEVTVEEARRCLSCDLGTAVHDFTIDINKCDGCGLCLDCCDRNALSFSKT